MRGHDEQTHHLFSDRSPEHRVPVDHTLLALTDHARPTRLRLCARARRTRAAG